LPKEGHGSQPTASEKKYHVHQNHKQVTIQITPYLNIRAKECRRVASFFQSLVFQCSLNIPKDLVLNKRELKTAIHVPEPCLWILLGFNSKGLAYTTCLELKDFVVLVAAAVLEF
jgi:hypothetical protein